MTHSAVIVLGSVNTDLVVRSARLPVPGETVLGGQFFQAAGGKGANQAVAAARLSKSPVVFIAAVGDDALGQTALENFRRENLHTEFVRTVESQATGVALILVDATGENMISVASGANLALSPADVERVPQAVPKEANVFLASLESPLETVLAGLKRASEAGLLTILNPAPVGDPERLRELLPWVSVITPNAGEAAAMLAEPATSHDTSPAALAKKLQALGCRRVVMTLGSRGCLVADEGETTMIPSFPVTAVDATGAGDAFNGALAVALSEGRSLLEAARWANGAGALAATRAGAQPSLPTRSELDHFCSHTT
jgi:ribokinase